MAKSIDTIKNVAEETQATTALRLGTDGATVALAMALGQLCATSDVDLARVLALVELAHREQAATKTRAA